MLGLTDREMLGRLLDDIVGELTLGVALETVVCTGDAVFDLMVGMTLVADVGLAVGEDENIGLAVGRVLDMVVFAAVGFLLGDNVGMVLCAIVGDETG